MPKPYISHKFRIQKNEHGQYDVYLKLPDKTEVKKPELSVSSGRLQTETYLRSQFPFCKIGRS